MKESILQGRIRAFLINNGWFVVKLINCSKPGMPDLLCIKDGKVIFFEVKYANGKPTKLQLHTIETLRNAGVEAHVVWTLDEVKSIISYT